jgi:hypothetical protein
MKTKLFVLVLLALVATAALWWCLRPNPAPLVLRSGQQGAGPVQAKPSVGVAHPGRRAPTSPAAVPATGTSQSAWAVELIVDSTKDYQERTVAIQALTTNLSQADQTALSSFLLRRDAADESQLGQAAKNALMDRLCELDPPPPWVGQVLVQIYRDSKQDDVLRDYAVQHLAALYEQVDKGPEAEREVRIAELNQVQDTLWEALAEKDGSIAGTALLALNRLAESRTEFDAERLAGAAQQLAGDGSAGELTRIAALQVCGRLGASEALPTVMAAAVNGPTTAVRISAVGALGELGNPDALPLLNSLVNGTEERLKLPARQALSTIQQKAALAANRRNETHLR